jgi:spermidine synthase
MRYCAGIFLVSAATLLLEIALTRIFSVLFFHHFAFLVISTALFGFGFSGIVLFLRGPRAAKLDQRLALFSLLFAVTILLATKVVLALPYQFPEVSGHPAQVLRLALNYAVLAVPFFFSGLVIALLLNSFSAQSGKLYAFDLTGAAAGCLAVLWLVPWLGASGAIVVAAALATAAALVFRPSVWGAVVLAATVFLLPNAESYFALPIESIISGKQDAYWKRSKGIEYSAWSPVSRIDVISSGPNRTIMLDGGSNVSAMIRFDGNVAALDPRWNWRAVPYALGQRNEVCIVGPGGGEDVLMALSHHSDLIDAVEMDPLIVEIVRGKYNGFLGGIFNHPSVHLVNDEGRSYLRRAQRQYDLIQQVHNISPMAIASGALNLSESYLLTREAFTEYWDHLTPGGMLAVNRWGILRAASIASVVLQEKGISDPENYVLVTSRKQSGKDTSFYLKKGRITPQDLDALNRMSDQLNVRIEYAPAPLYANEQNPYYRLLVPSLRDAFIQNADLVLDAPTDDWPFFDHFQRFGSLRTASAILPREFNPILEYFNLGDLALLAILGEAVILSSLFLLWPLIRMRRTMKGSPSQRRYSPLAKAQRTQGLEKIENVSSWAVPAYFSALGAGFILIEISLIQKHILFLGQPVYSISSVLFSLLLSAGAGSWTVQRFFREGAERRWLGVVLALLAATIVFEVVAAPSIFDALLGAGRMARFVVSGVVIAPLGALLGIPFPLGIRLLGSRSPEAVPWAWGVNAYATVVGSILCVIIAVTFGFRVNFALAFALYTTGFLLFTRIKAT